jgi:CPA2 family monovalent cation:H+ antiporter-2
MGISDLRARLGGMTPRIEALTREEAPSSELLAGHVIIGGFGLNGRNLARVLRATRLPHMVVDLNPDSLHLEAAEGSHTLVGDITREIIQKQAGIARARVLVLALSDPTATRQACRIARRLSDEVQIIVRTRYVTEIDDLFAIGANQVIPEEFETSIEIFTAVLRDFHVPHNVIQAQILLLRQERYSLLRGRKLPGTVVEQLEAILAEGTTDTFLLLQHSPAVGRKLGDLGLEGTGGCSVVAVVRGGRPLPDVGNDLVLRVGDTLVLTGNHAEMERAFQKLRPANERA